MFDVCVSSCWFVVCVSYVSSVLCSVSCVWCVSVYAFFCGRVRRMVSCLLIMVRLLQVSSSVCVVIACLVLVVASS